jgi:hypothetical protein
MEEGEKWLQILMGSCQAQPLLHAHGLPEKEAGHCSMGVLLDGHV